MTPEEFLAQFGHIADAPNGVQKLRALILDLAVRGKLVPQDPNDEPASELLKRIEKEKAQHAKTQRRKGKKIICGEIMRDKIPYDLPPQWQWTRMGNVTVIRTGKLDANASSPSGKYPFFTCAKYPLRIDRFAYDCECVLLAGNGNFDVNYYNGKFEAYQRTYIIEQASKNLLSVPYIYRFIQRYAAKLREISIGGVIQYIKISFLTDALFPLPPLAEQKRIVAKVDELMGLCDRLEAAKKRRAEIRGRATEAALHALVESEDAEVFAANWRRIHVRFDDLIDSLDTLKQLRATILDLAVRGKLICTSGSTKGFVGDQVSFQNGYAFKSTWFKGKGVRVVRNVNVGHDTIHWVEVARVSEQIADEFHRFALRENDIVLSLDRPLITTGLKVRLLRWIYQSPIHHMTIPIFGCLPLRSTSRTGMLIPI